MATVVESAPGLQQLFKDISTKFDPTESENVVQSLKKNYGGKFNSLDDRDLLPCLQLLEKYWYVSDNKLKLIEDFVAPKSNKEELIKKDIEMFKASRPAEPDPDKEFQGRDNEIKKINKKLESGHTSVVNLFGSSGVGKTRLAGEVCSQWRGNYHVFDLREANDMRAIYRNMLNSLGLAVPIGYVDHNIVVTQIHENIQPLKSEGRPVLFLLDNVDQFNTVQGKEGKNLRTAFIQFLEKLTEFEGKSKRSALKLLLTSRTQLKDTKKVDNFEVKSLESSFSEKILFPKGMTDVNAHEKDKLIGITKGFPLVLKGLAAILRQERKSADNLIAGFFTTSKKSKVEEDAKEEPVSFEEEGVDMGQLSAIGQMFDTLPTENLKVSAVSISLFHGPFSVKTAAKVLGISQSEALAQLEGLVASAIIFVVEEEAKERKYDIHPLLRKYADSIKSHGNYFAAYMEAKGRFHELFMSRMEKIAELIEPDYVRAFSLFETDKANYEFTVDISLQPEYFSVPGEFQENALIASLFVAMLNEDKLIKVFHSWAEMCEDDGKSGSLCRAQLKSWEARQVVDVDGTEKAFEVLKTAFSSLEKVQDKSSETYMLTKGLYLYSKGDILWKNKDYKKALESLESSLELSEGLLKEHTDLARCYNSIGNCLFSLNQPMKALEFYEKAYKMQKELGGSEHHFDMPTYKNQIGTAYESQGDYDKAIEYYRDALELLDELKISGSWDEALFRRNLANALMHQGKYSEAVEPANRAYNLRVKIHGNHPLTVRSIFQRAVIQANFADFKKALELFLEAWEMEKTLAVGNHSVVWRKIITGVEDMCDFLKERKRKERFRKDALKFCQRFWEEQKASHQFTFNEYNKDIIDAFMDLVVNDKKAKYEIQKEQLWFYEGMYNANEEYFEEDFDQETDNDALNEMLKNRDELLDEVIDFCAKLDEHERLSHHKTNKLTLYKQFLVKPDFLGKKEYGLDKASLKTKVEQLYEDVGQAKTILDFRENLLHAWQRQWEEGKSEAKTNKIGVGREKTIDGILQLCKEIKKENMYIRYGQEALSFYDEMWEVKHVNMKNPEMKKFLRKIKELASSIGDYGSEKLYKDALQALIETGKHPGATLRPRAALATSKSEEEEDDKEEEEEEIVVESEEEIVVGSDEVIVVGFEDESVVGAEDETELVAEGVPTEDRSIIFRDTVTKHGSHWEVTKAAIHVIFPLDVVSEDTILTIFRWNPSLCSPPLQDNEAVVSSVLELSAENPEDLEFHKEVTLGISHSAPDLKGYEVVVKTLINRDRNEWEDVDKTVDFRSLSDLQKSYGDNFPNYFLPVAEIKITQCSTFAVVCRLKCHMFTITSEPSTLSLPDFPLVKVHIPEKAVPATEEFFVTVRVQEFRRNELKDKEMLAGPILRIFCNKEVEFREPVTVQLPLSLRGKEDVESLGISDLSQLRARVLFQPSSDTLREWTEITDRLEPPPWLDGTVIKFNVKHFSGFWSWLASPLVQLTRGWNTESVPHAAIFTATVPADTELDSTTKLKLYCSPHDKKREHIRNEQDLLLEEESAWHGMLPNDQAYVFLSGDVVRPVNVEHMQNLFVRFQQNASMLRSLRVRVVDSGCLTIKFCSNKEQREETMLCRLEMELPPLTRDPEKIPVEFFGVPLDDRILHEAPLMDILAECRGVLEEINQWNIYQGHFERNSDGHTRYSFYKALASLPPEDQQKCFDTIVGFLRGSGGLRHIAYRLLQAEALVKQPANESVRGVVADKLRAGSLWKKLARDLNIRDPVIDAIEEEEADCQERCIAALRRWYENNGSSATSRELMLRLTNMGYGNVNWHIMRELGLVSRENMPPSDR